MTAVAAPFGFKPVYHPTGRIVARKYTIASGTTPAIGQNDPVTLSASGVITIAAVTGDILGVFQGVEYVDSVGKPTVSNFWPASTVATQIVAWVVDDPATVFEVQSAGSVAQLNIGEEAATSTPSLNTATGLSTTSLSVTMAATQNQFRIIGFGGGVDNAPGDAFTIVQVQIAQSTLAAAKVGI